MALFKINLKSMLASQRRIVNRFLLKPVDAAEQQSMLM